MKQLINIIALGGLLATAWFFQDPLLNMAGVAESRYLPCLRPIPYAIKNFDERFGLSEEEFLSAIKDAEAIWEGAAGRDLFRPLPEVKAGSLAISLIYDERQEATAKLQELGLAIDDSKKTYDELNARYQSLQEEYNAEKALLDRLLVSYESAKEAYEKKVNYWNSRGGAPRATYAELESERLALNKMGQQIKTMEASLKTLAENINTVVVVLNRIASDLNLTAKTFNRIGSSEFEEGLFKSDVTGRSIDIYQFDDRNKLVRVLAHELGHALGLEHIEDPEAIMYRLNQGQNPLLTEADLNELRARCSIKN